MSVLFLAASFGLWSQPGPASAPGADRINARSAFELLKKLAGDWEGTTGTKEGSPALVNLRVSANGNTVIWTEFPGAAHEMTSMMHLDGGNARASDRVQRRTTWDRPSGPPSCS